jgi:hypothetical protein
MTRGSVPGTPRSPAAAPGKIRPLSQWSSADLRFGPNQHVAVCLCLLHAFSRVTPVAPRDAGGFVVIARQPLDPCERRRWDGQLRALPRGHLRERGQLPRGWLLDRPRAPALRHGRGCTIRRRRRRAAQRRADPSYPARTAVYGHEHARSLKGGYVLLRHARTATASASASALARHLIAIGRQPPTP